MVAEGSLLFSVHGERAPISDQWLRDPTTSTQALDLIELLLREIRVRRLTPGVGRDSTGMVRATVGAETSAE